MNSFQKNSILLSLVVILASFALIHLKLVEPRRTLQEQKSSLTDEIASKTNRLSKIQELKVPLASLETNVSQLFTVGLPKGESLPDLIEEVESAVLSQGDFRLVSFDPNLSNGSKSSVGASGMVETSFNITVRGNANKLSSVFDVLHSNLRPMYVKSITIAPDTSDGAAANDISASLALVTFSLPVHDATASSTSATANQ